MGFVRVVGNARWVRVTETSGVGNNIRWIKSPAMNAEIRAPLKIPD